MHEFWFVAKDGKRRKYMPMFCIRKVHDGEWRKRAEYPVEGGSVIIHEYEKAYTEDK